MLAVLRQTSLVGAMGEESAGDRTLGILSLKGGGRGLCELRFEHARLVGSAGGFSHWKRTHQRLERVLSFGCGLGNLNRFFVCASCIHNTSGNGFIAYNRSRSTLGTSKWD